MDRRRESGASDARAFWCDHNFYRFDWPCDWCDVRFRVFLIRHRDSTMATLTPLQPGMPELQYSDDDPRSWAGRLPHSGEEGVLFLGEVLVEVLNRNWAAAVEAIEEPLLKSLAFAPPLVFGDEGVDVLGCRKG